VSVADSVAVAASTVLVAVGSNFGAQVKDDAGVVVGSVLWHDDNARMQATKTPQSLAVYI